MTKKNLLKLILFFVIATVVIAVAQIAYLTYSDWEKENNHDAIVELADNQITYEPEVLDDQLAILESWTSKRNLYDEDRGRLYERESLLYKMKGDMANYSRSLGSALFYLEKSDDVNYTANLELDLAMFYVINSNYECARDAIEQIEVITDDFNDITDIQVLSYAHRMRAIVASYYKDYKSAEKDLATAREVLRTVPDALYTESYYAIIDANLAKIYVLEGRKVDARAILYKYKDSPFFTQQIYASVIVRDFVMPYYEASIYLALEENGDVGSLITEYMDYCEKYDYMVAALQTVLYISDNYPPEDSDSMEGFFNIAASAYRKATELETTTYTSLIDGDIQISKELLSGIEESYNARRHRFRLYLLIFALVVAGLAAIRLIASTGRVDGLTQVRNRGAFNREMARIERNPRPLAVLMMDIDDFKRVNDTYGHQSGDEVLSRLGKILNSLKGKNVVPYRYGGEEFAVLIKDKAVVYPELLAEKIRSTFAREKYDFGGPFTISLGVAYDDKGSENVVKEADANLYESKQNGKNKVTYRIN